MIQFINELSARWHLPDEYKNIVHKALDESGRLFPEIEEIAACNQLQVLDAFQKNRVSDFHLHGSTGYGYGDTGRDVLENIFCDLFKAEKSLVRSNLVSGTHALATVLYGVLRPGDRVLSITGKPYDTLLTVFGNPGKPGTLCEYGIIHDVAELQADHSFDTSAIISQLGHKKYRMICIQRSRGYALRSSVNISQIQAVIKTIKEHFPDVIIFVDNCYGEFVETREPLEVGADIIAGSLIKNPGGGLAIRGGYICGREDLITLAAHRLTAPGIHQDVSSALDFNRTIYQGLFMAPLIVEQAVKGAVFTAALFSRLGFEVFPDNSVPRTDIVQALVMKTPEMLELFCRDIQSASPIDSFVRPAYGDLPGYSEPVIMAGGTFIQGSSIELSADGPMREPYAAYIQGGLSFHHAMYASVKAGLTIFNKKGE